MTKHCVCFARIGRYSENSRHKRDDACAAQNYLFLHNWRK